MREHMSIFSRQCDS